MVKEIAIYMDKNGQVTELSEEGIIKVFSRENDSWNLKKELLLEFNSDILNFVEVLGNCKVLVVKGISDFMYKLLDSVGLSIWKMEGDQNKILEDVFEKEEAAAEEIKLIDFFKYNEKMQNINPIEIGNSGCYTLSLKYIQEHNTSITTKQALKPFLNDKKFYELIVTCTHIPNWLESELKKLDLSFEFSKVGLDDYIVVIYNKENKK